MKCMLLLRRSSHPSPSLIYIRHLSSGFGNVSTSLGKTMALVYEKFALYDINVFLICYVVLGYFRSWSHLNAPKPSVFMSGYNLRKETSYSTFLLLMCKSVDPEISFVAWPFIWSYKYNPLQAFFYFLHLVIFFFLAKWCILSNNMHRVFRSLLEQLVIFCLGFVSTSTTGMWHHYSDTKVIDSVAWFNCRSDDLPLTVNSQNNSSRPSVRWMIYHSFYYRVCYVQPSQIIGYWMNRRNYYCQLLNVYRGIQDNCFWIFQYSIPPFMIIDQSILYNIF